MRRSLPISLVALTVLQAVLALTVLTTFNPAISRAQAGSIDASYDSARTAPEGLSPAEWVGIRGAHREWRHRFVRHEDGTFSAGNPGQQWSTTFDGRGFLVRPEGREWSWGLELTGYGVGESRQPVSSKTGSGPEAKGTRLSYRRDEILEEWFINDGRGLEQGWILSKRPAGAADGSLRLDLSVRGGLRPVITDADASAKRVSFVSGDGVAALTYGGLKAWDATGRALPVRFVVAEADHISVEVDERSDVTYPVMIDPIAQLAYLKADNTQADDRFGNSVSVSGDTVVVGAPNEDSSTTGVNSEPDEGAPNAGAVYVFTHDEAGVWSQQAYLKAGNADDGDQFGTSVAISGDTLVVGAQFEASGTTGVNSTPDEAAILSGAAYVFTRDAGGVWSEQAYLKPSNTGSFDKFGAEVAVAGNLVVVGATGEDSSTAGVDSVSNNSASDTGAAYVFTRDQGGAWSQQAFLKASTPGDSDDFGFSVAVADDTVVVGARLEDSSTTGVDSVPDDDADNAGAVCVFRRDGDGVWSEEAYLKAGNTGIGDLFGCSVSISGNTVVVGALSEDSGTTGVNSVPDDETLHSGAAYVFTRDGGGEWSQQAYLKASNTGFKDFFGRSVSISGNTLVVGASGESSSSTGVDSVDDDTAIDAGAAYVFTRNNRGAWSQEAYLKASNAGGDDNFGISVSVSGDTAVVGAFFESSSTTGIDSTPDDAATGAGAAYVFHVPIPKDNTALKLSLLKRVKKLQKVLNEARKKSLQGKVGRLKRQIKGLQRRLRTL